MKYFKTTDLTPGKYAERVRSAESQEGIIQKFFNDHPAEKFTASDIEHALKTTGALSDRVPITSIRRAMSTLQKDGRINKLAETKVGPHNDPEHFYQLSTGWGKTAGAGYAEIHPQQPELF